MRSSDPNAIRAEVRAAAALCGDAGAGLAVTFEEAQLSDEELVTAAAAALAYPSRGRGQAEAGASVGAVAGDRAVRGNPSRPRISSPTCSTRASISAGDMEAKPLLAVMADS